MNSQQLISHLGELPWPKVAVYGFIAVLLYYFLLYDDGTALRNRFTATTAQLAQAQKGLDETRKAMEDADKFEREVKLTAQQFERIRDFMPEDLNAASLTEIILHQASMAGAKVLKLEPKQGDERVDFYEMTRVQVSLEGSYAQLVTFLSYLSRVPKLLTFDTVKITRQGGDPETPKLKFVGTLVGYRYVKPPEAKGDAAGQSGTAQGNGGATNANP